VLDPQFVADCPYAAEAILFDEILELDRDGTHIHAARYGTLARIGPPLVLECRATQVRRIRGSIYVRYTFRFEQEGAPVYESEQGAVWHRAAGGE
jgi:hypothetical protein